MEPWLGWALLAAAFAAATAILSKAGLRGVDPDSAQLIRTAAALAAMAAVVAATGRWQGMPRHEGRTWLLLGLAGLATAASWACYFRALAVGQASRVAALDKLSVPLVAVAAALLLGERMGAMGWLGVALMCAGAMMVSLGR